MLSLVLESKLIAFLNFFIGEFGSCSCGYYGVIGDMHYSILSSFTISSWSGVGLIKTVESPLRFKNSSCWAEVKLPLKSEEIEEDSYESPKGNFYLLLCDLRLYTRFIFLNFGNLKINK